MNIHQMQQSGVISIGEFGEQFLNDPTYENPSILSKPIPKTSAEAEVKYLTELLVLKTALIGKLMEQNKALRDGVHDQIGWVMTTPGMQPVFASRLDPALQQLELGGEKMWKPVYL